MPPSFANSRGVTYQEIGAFVAAARRAIAPRRDHRKPVVYPFAGVDFIGHIWFDPHILRTLFPADAFQVFIVPLPLSHRMDPRMAGFAMRGLEVVDGIDLDPQILFRVASTLFHDQSRFDFGDLHVMFGGASRLASEQYHHAHRGLPNRATVALTEEETTAGAETARRAGIDPDRPLAVLHVRSPGYNQEHDFNRFRDCDIARYVPAIEMLAARGYTILRIGDPSMPPLPVSGPHIHDGAHHAHRSALFDVWAIATSAFMIHCYSGPYDIGRAFGRPLLGINTYLSDFGESEAGHLMLPKRVEESATARALDFAEILERRLTCLWHNAQLDHLGLRLVEAEAEAIEHACVEFVDGLGKPAGAPTRFERLNEAENALRREVGGTHPEDRYWAMDLPGSRLAAAFLDRNPGFLDRPPPPIEDRPPPPPPRLYRTA
ncbi:MAG: TIGR04372 family glycosyltransferase [Rhodospirillaceae bacterium]|nr:TIGR04372 family glycosyltransferase [Rhodospirillaceae bacterium]